MKKIFSLLTLAVILLGSVGVPSIYACTAIPGSPWYSLDIQITDNPLADAAAIRDVDSEVHFEQDYISINVQSLQSDLYFIAHDLDMLYPGYHVSQKDYRPVAHIIGNKYEPRLRFGVEQNSLKGGRVFHGGWGQRENVKDDSARVSIFSLLDETPAYESRQKRGDDRPAAVKLPEPQPFTILTHYQGKMQGIKGVINYKLNKSYNPNAEKVNTERCGMDIINAQTDKSRLDSSTDKTILTAALALIPFATILFLAMVRGAKGSEKKIKKRKK